MHVNSIYFSVRPAAVIYTLSLHDALPISRHAEDEGLRHVRPVPRGPAAEEPHGHPGAAQVRGAHGSRRSEEHTSELQSQSNLVCRLLLEKKKSPTNSVSRLVVRGKRLFTR